MLEVTLVSKSDERGGGASRVCAQLHDLLLQQPDVQVRAWTADRHPRLPRNSLRGGALRDVFYRAGRVASRQFGFPDFLLPDRLTATARRRLPGGVTHVHDISNAASPLALRLWSRHAPVLWTAHDCSPFTGGCIYPMECDHFVGTRCGNCPQLGRWPLLTSVDRTGAMQRYKVDLINRHASALICPSRWIGGQAAAAGVDPAKIRYVPNAVDSAVFAPRDRLAARHALGLPGDARIVLLASMDFTNPYKGMAHAMETLERQSGTVHVVTVGANDTQLRLPRNVVHHGLRRLFDREAMAACYGAADALLFPSLADNCPLTVLEAMACGLPVVAFDTGGVGELVTHRSSGWLAARGDTAELAHGLSLVLTDTAVRDAWSESAREEIVRAHTEEGFVSAHLDLYREFARN